MKILRATSFENGREVLASVSSKPNFVCRDADPHRRLGFRAGGVRCNLGPGYSGSRVPPRDGVRLFRRFDPWRLGHPLVALRQLGIPLAARISPYMAPMVQRVCARSSARGGGILGKLS